MRVAAPAASGQAWLAANSRSADAQRGSVDSTSAARWYARPAAAMSPPSRESSRPRRSSSAARAGTSATLSTCSSIAAAASSGLPAFSKSSAAV